MMDPIIKQKWIEALKSGKYKQHNDYCLYLKTNNGYNFLGVLLEELKLRIFIFDSNYYKTSDGNFYDIRHVANQLNFDDKPLYFWVEYPFSIVSILLKLDPNL